MLRRGVTRGGLDYSWRIFRECAGPGYFLLGDAACLMDPSAANGVLRALMSGMYAAHLISAVDQGRATYGQVVAEYKSWISRLFDQTRKELHAVEQKEQHHEDARLSGGDLHA
jgi:flavin-dependent dehydrogenase